MTAFDVDAFGTELATSSTCAHAYALRLAKEGDATAQTIVGQMFLDGQGCDAQPVEAVYWFMQAAHLASPMAMNMLGRCHENGWGAVVNHELAAVWFRRAAEHGLDWGMYNYAHVLEQGRGLRESRIDAFAWFSRAAALGHARAMCFLARYFEHGWETPQDLPRAYALYEASANAGDYRGECAWASVLAGQGRHDEARAFLERGLSKAPEAFVASMKEVLLAHPSGGIRGLSTACDGLWG
ncbi:tetratricopeptide repeat protein [Luteibacter aegosomatissinici]|uniref:tetratricopeptide repeat protein n=1 Tax=Luteibacter aegosomatissinici TaxID=2911539 RepID=UPI001FF96E00|nr:tetratricopeptide repeat protein [Luteibacter aegosomatissinici]UPG96286.1 sel1 repeat family protein [Luteibacter aegosomatissinici]